MDPDKPMIHETDHTDVVPEIQRLRQRVQELEQVEEERDRLQAALRRGEEHARVFVTYTPVAAAMVDRNMCYILASHQWIADFGLKDTNSYSAAAPTYRRGIPARSSLAL